MKLMYVYEESIGDRSIRIGINVPEVIESKDREGYALGVKNILEKITGNREKQIIAQSLRDADIIEYL